jgi:hypothetical protein
VAIHAIAAPLEGRLQHRFTAAHVKKVNSSGHALLAAYRFADSPSEASAGRRDKQKRYTLRQSSSNHHEANITAFASRAALPHSTAMFHVNIATRAAATPH